MRVESHNQLRDPVSVEATRVVVWDEDQPIMVVVQMGPHQFCCAHVGDSDFQSMLQSLGIDKTVVVRPSNFRKLGE